MVRILISLGMIAVFAVGSYAQDSTQKLVQDATMSELYLAIKKDSSNAMAWFELAEMNTNNRDFAEAMQNYNKVLELQPNNAMAYKNRGRLKGYLADYRGSIVDFTIAIGLDKNFSDAYFDRGLSRLKIKQYAGAAEDFDAVLKMDPLDKVAWFNRGRALLGLDLKDDGCLALSKAGELGYFEAYDYIRNHCD